MQRSICQLDQILWQFVMIWNLLCSSCTSEPQPSQGSPTPQLHVAEWTCRPVAFRAAPMALYCSLTSSVLGALQLSYLQASIGQHFS